ncbi:uncharacterized protein HaLaN_00008 [Haematococcus lacustris]|uniref:Uncharacterized protein n=1 Tax=Haematococcus lacustris TaxID=44745 RepID=A0A699Y8D9_HAELA|nr:uncharacterized protein HaLaN_00008 [Haematococcus lacustris]
MSCDDNLALQIQIANIVAEACQLPEDQQQAFLQSKSALHPLSQYHVAANKASCQHLPHQPCGQQVSSMLFVRSTSHTHGIGTVLASCQHSCCCEQLAWTHTAHAWSSAWELLDKPDPQAAAGGMAQVCACILCITDPRVRVHASSSASGAATKARAAYVGIASTSLMVASEPSWALNYSPPQPFGELAVGAHCPGHVKAMLEHAPLQLLFSLLGQGYAVVLTGQGVGGMVAHCLAARLLLQLRQEIELAQQHGINLQHLQLTEDKVTSIVFGSPLFSNAAMLACLAAHGVDQHLHTIVRAGDGSPLLLTLCSELAELAKEPPPPLVPQGEAGLAFSLRSPQFTSLQRWATHLFTAVMALERGPHLAASMACRPLPQQRSVVDERQAVQGGAAARPGAPVAANQGVTMEFVNDSGTHRGSTSSPHCLPPLASRIPGSAEDAEKGLRVGLDSRRAGMDTVSDTIKLASSPGRPPMPCLPPIALPTGAAKPSHRAALSHQNSYSHLGSVDRVSPGRVSGAMAGLASSRVRGPGAAAVVAAAVATLKAGSPAGSSSGGSSPLTRRTALVNRLDAATASGGVHASAVWASRSSDSGQAACRPLAVHAATQPWQPALEAVLALAPCGVQHYIPIGRFWVLEVEAGELTSSCAQGSKQGGPGLRLRPGHQERSKGTQGGRGVGASETAPAPAAALVSVPCEVVLSQWRSWLSASRNPQLLRCWEYGLEELRRELMEAFAWTMFHPVITAADSRVMDRKLLIRPVADLDACS